MASLWDLLKQHAAETYDTLSQGKVGQDLRADANKIKGNAYGNTVISTSPLRVLTGMSSTTGSITGRS